jgi:hypothetical protein
MPQCIGEIRLRGTGAESSALTSFVFDAESGEISNNTITTPFENNNFIRSFVESINKDYSVFDRSAKDVMQFNAGEGFARNISKRGDSMKVLERILPPDMKVPADIQQMLDIVEDKGLVDTLIIAPQKVEGTQKGVNGFHRKKRKLIVVSAESKSGLLNTLRHELYHALTHDAIENDPQIFAHIRSFYGEVKRAAKADPALMSKLDAVINKIEDVGVANNNMHEYLTYLFMYSDNAAAIMSHPMLKNSENLKYLAENIYMPSPVAMKPSDSEDINKKAADIQMKRNAEEVAKNAEQDKKDDQNIIDTQEGEMYNLIGTIVNNDDKMKMIKFDAQNRKYSNVEEALTFFEERKDRMHEFWGQETDITNDYQVANINSGDVIKIPLVHTFFYDTAQEYGIPGSWVSMTMVDIIEKFESERGTVDRKIQAKRDELLKQFSDFTKKSGKTYNLAGRGKFYGFDENIKDIKISELLNKIEKERGTVSAEIQARRDNLKRTIRKHELWSKNVITAGVFWDEELESFAAYVPARGFSGEQKGKVLMNKVPLSKDSVLSIRRLAPEFKTRYKKEGNNLVEVQMESSRYAEAIKKDAALIDEATAVMKNLKDRVKSDQNFKDQYANADYFIGTTTKYGEWVTAKFNKGIEATGFFGEMGEFARGVDNMSIVKYIAGRTKTNKAVMAYGVKIGNTPGGIVILDSNNQVATIGDNSITAVIADIKNTELSKEDQEIQEKLNKAFFRNSKIAVNSTVFPFFNTQTDYSSKEEQEEARASMASNLKPGDWLLVRYKSKDKGWTQSYHQVVYASSTRVIYKTQKGVGEVDPRACNNLKNIKLGNDYTVTKDGKNKYTGDGDTEIVTAYSPNNKAHLYEYFKSVRDVADKFWNQETRKMARMTGSSIDEVISSALGLNFGESAVTEDGKIDPTKASIDSEWDIIDLRDDTLGEKIRQTSKLIPGDLIQTIYTDDKGKEHVGTHIFVEYSNTGVPLYVEFNRKKNIASYFTVRVNPEDIAGIGRRMTPICAVNIDGEVKYMNNFAQNIEQSGIKAENIHTISEGRPTEYANVMQRFSNLIETGRKSALFNSEQEAKDAIAEMRTKFKSNYNIITKEKAVDAQGREAWFFVGDNGKVPDGWKLVPGNTKYGLTQTTKNGKTRHVRNMELGTHFNQSTSSLSFDEVLSKAQRGMYATIKRKHNGKDVYYDGIILSKGPNKLRIAWLTKGDNGQYTQSTMYVTNKTADAQVISLNMSNQDYAIIQSEKHRIERRDAARENKGQEVKPKAKATPQVAVNQEEEVKRLLEASKNNPVPFSKKTKNFNKTHDSKQTIVSMANRMGKLYGVAVECTDTKGFKALSEELGQDLSNVRGLVYNGKVYINWDIASTADVLHELTHLILPGLKASNPEAYGALMAKVQQHPVYDQVREEYANLSDEDLAEEAFCTIFGEFFRGKLMNDDAANWYDEDFDNLSAEVSGVLKNTLNLKNLDATTMELMNMTLEEIMAAFGSDLYLGRLDKFYNLSKQINTVKTYQKMYQSLIDTGQLVKLC